MPDAHATRRFEVILAQEAARRALVARAHRLYADRPAATFPGFTALLHELVPSDEGTCVLLGGALEMHPDALGSLVVGDVDAGQVDIDAVIALARTLRLSREEFFALIGRDLDVRLDELGVTEGRARQHEHEELNRAYSDAWELERADFPREDVPRKAVSPEGGMPGLNGGADAP